MVNGENRAKMKQLTIHAGEGVRDFAASTVDAIKHSVKIPETRETCFDHSTLIRPTLRSREIIMDPTHMAKGENRATIKEGVAKTGGGIKSAKMKQLTIHAGEGVRDFAASTVDAIKHSVKIPETRESCFDHSTLIRPTLRSRGIIKDPTHMAKGENRATIKEGIAKTGGGIKRLTSGVGGIKRLTSGVGSDTKDTIVLQEKIETCIDRLFIAPTLRLVDFTEDLTRRSRERAHRDKAWNERVRKAQEGARRLKVIHAQPMEDVQHSSFHAQHYPKRKEDSALIEAALKKNEVFSGLTSSNRAGLASAFEDLRVKVGAKIIEEGDVGDYFYVLAEGEVQFQVGGNDIGSASKGSCFGELALLYEAPRAFTVIAKTHCGLFRLGQETFKKILAKQMKDCYEEVLGILKKVPFFKDLDDENLNKVWSNLRAIKYDDGAVMISRERNTPPSLFIIKEGIVDVTGLKIGGSDYASVRAGGWLGENVITNNEWAIGTAKARGRVVALTLNRGTFIRVFGSDFSSLVKKIKDKRQLALIPFGKRMGPDDHDLDLIVGAIKEKKFPKGHVFFNEGVTNNPALYLIREGKVSIRSSNHPNLESVLGFHLDSKSPKTIEKGGYFGNDTLGANVKAKIGLALYTVTALEDIQVGVLDVESLMKLANSYSKEGKKEVIGMEDLNMIRILGAGTFGKVWLVSCKRSGDPYALKIQVKKQLIEHNQPEGIIREKNIMAKLDHPFIIKMVNHWKDDNKLYMLLKMYQGGELQSVIHTNTRDGIPEFAATFYSANILEGLSHMHHRNIIYRDLKPENVLLDNNGYTVIVDLGFAKIVKGKTYTFCGSPLYLAPEIIMQKGHDKGADHWSWGVLLYEMIVGMTPFYDGVVDQMGLFKNIIHCRMEFPGGDFMSLFAKDLIKKMLTVNPHDRLGSFSNAEKDIKAHPFFQYIDWTKLCEKDIKAPFLPTVSDPLDGSNFDDYSRLEAKAKREKVQELTLTEQKLFDKF